MLRSVSGSSLSDGKMVTYKKRDDVGTNLLLFILGGFFLNCHWGYSTQIQRSWLSDCNPKEVGNCEGF